MRPWMHGCLVVLLVLAACTSSDKPPDRGPVTPLDLSTAGTIRGKVRFEGTPPASSMLRISGDTNCGEQGTVSADDVLVRDGRVENAFVYVRDGLGNRVFELPKDAVTIDQNGCRYLPRVLGTETGQEIVFLNSDPTLHNVHTSPQSSRGINFGMAKKGTRRSIRINTAEVMVKVQCDVHPWMRAWIGVLDHPYFTLTGKDGSFELRNVPPGSYVLEAWHERLGRQEAKVTLGDEGSAEVELVFKGDQA